jgi:hypothetical protein
VCSFGVSNFCSVGLVAPVVLQVISHERGRKTGLSLRQTEKWAETILYHKLIFLYKMVEELVLAIDGIPE